MLINEFTYKKRMEKNKIKKQKIIFSLQVSHTRTFTRIQTSKMLGRGAFGRVWIIHIQMTINCGLFHLSHFQSHSLILFYIFFYFWKEFDRNYQKIRCYYFLNVIWTPNNVYLLIVFKTLRILMWFECKFFSFFLVGLKSNRSNVHSNVSIRSNYKNLMCLTFRNRAIDKIICNQFLKTFVYPM